MTIDDTGMDEFACKRLAIEIAATLPENSKDALHVLALAKELVENWLGKPAEVVPFVARRESQ
jgi:hypothetical protein